MKNHILRRTLSLLLCMALLGGGCALAENFDAYTFELPEGAADMTNATFSEQMAFAGQFTDPALAQMAYEWLDTDVNGRDARLVRMQNGLALATLEARPMESEFSLPQLMALWPQVAAALGESYTLEETGDACVSTDVLGGMRCCMFQTLGTMNDGGLPVELVMYTVCYGGILYEVDLILPQKNYFAEGSDMAKALASDVTDVLAWKSSIGFATVSDEATEPPLTPDETPLPVEPSLTTPEGGPEPASPTPAPDDGQTPDDGYTIPQYAPANYALAPLEGDAGWQTYTDLDRGFTLEIPEGTTIVTPDVAFDRLVDYYMDESVGEDDRRMEAWLVDSITYETTLFILPDDEGMIGVIAQEYMAQTLSEMEAGEQLILLSMEQTGYRDITRIDGAGTRYTLGQEEYYMLPVTMRLNDDAVQTTTFIMFARCQGTELREVNLWQPEGASEAVRSELIRMAESVRYTGIVKQTKLN